MIAKPIHTEIILPSKFTLTEILDKYLPQVPEGSVVAVSSKIVSLCEGRVADYDESKKDSLIQSEAELFLPRDESIYEHSFTVLNSTLIAVAGIDESNSAGNFVLWPMDPQKTANSVREFLVKKYGLKKVGVIITDSTSFPMRYGTKGIAIAHSGFEALNDYRGSQDLFGHTFEVSVANIAEGLAAAAVLVMGEGTEQTPLAVMSDLPFVKFQDRNPSVQELDSLKLTIQTDLFEPFLNNGKWQKGGQD